MDSATGRIDAAIKSSSDSISGNGEGRVHGFGWAVDSAVRSTIASNSEISSVHGFGWAVENGIKSSTAPNFETQDTVHSIRWAVDDAIRSRVAPNPAPLHGFSSAVDNAISSKVGAETAAEAETDSEAELKEAWYVEGSWQKGEMLGKGSFGTVYEAISEFVFSFLLISLSIILLPQILNHHFFSKLYNKIFINQFMLKITINIFFCLFRRLSSKHVKIINK